MSKKLTKNTFINILLLLVLGISLWIGWSDYQFVKPKITQEEIRESIRFYIRTGFQVAVQYLIPLVILTYFGKKLFNRD